MEVAWEGAKVLRWGIGYPTVIQSGPSPDNDPFCWDCDLGGRCAAANYVARAGSIGAGVTPSAYDLFMMVFHAVKVLPMFYSGTVTVEKSPDFRKVVCG
ncbi:hypothetical protein PR001_g20935 [Phytophthora rubi]|uniref:Uncharacterized protein n=1 Tax=Phytophthora rubi TaxID=129364 RepID=A0A6A3JCZ9_9STRA|nr:hypothetical protein PR001_g20935 [Phytophthora rubi]